jgi:hypothetical protein
MITVYRLYLFTGKATGIENVDSIGFVPLQKKEKTPPLYYLRNGVFIFILWLLLIKVRANTEKLYAKYHNT